MKLVRKLAFQYAALIAFVLVLVIWQSLCSLLKVPEFVLPTPTAIIKSFTSLSVGRWLEHIAATLSVALSGYAIAIMISIPLAIAITRSALVSRVVMPWLVVIQSTPIVAIAPILITTLGASNLPRIVITTLIAFFPIVISTATGLRAVPAELIDLSRTLRAPKSREYWQIRIPYAMPYIFSSLRVAITLAIIGAVVAEFVSSEKGLGYLINFSMSNFKVPVAFSSLVILVICSLGLYSLITLIQKKLFAWSSNN